MSRLFLSRHVEDTNDRAGYSGGSSSSSLLRDRDREERERREREERERRERDREDRDRRDRE
eukprot:SAG25_NODE_4539_length_794_cov_1.369784_1_plen_61_part_10